VPTGPTTGPTTPTAEDDARDALAAEAALRGRVIAVERDELDRMVSRRKISREVADEVRAALDVDETTMRP